MDVKQLVDEYAEAAKTAARAKAKADALAAQLKQHMATGDKLEGHKHSVRLRDRAVLNAKLLKAKVSPSMWTNITERKPVAVLYKAMIQRGKLDENVIKECYTRSEAWIEVI